MAGYKQSVIDDDAVSLHSFDGDAFETFSRKLIVPDGEPNYIIDEIDNLNPAVLHSDHAQYLGYRLGMPSLVTHEQTDQYCISFGYYGQIPSHPSLYPKAFLEVPHSLSYAFPRYGSFTVEFLFNKTPEPVCGGNKPFIKKNGVFNINLNAACYSENLLNITHPGGSVSISFTNYLGSINLYSKTIHFVLSWEVIDLGNSRYKGTATVYLNGRIVSEQVYNYLDTFPNTNIASPIEVAGLIDSNVILSDRHSSSFMIDQIAIYDKALSKDQIIDHYAKAFPYGEMVKKDFASNFWAFDDQDSLVSMVVEPSIGTWKGEYVGDRNQIVRRNLGPSSLLNASSCSFQNGGHVIFESVGSINNYVPLNINKDYTYDFWFTASSANRGVLFSSQQFKYPFNGLLLELNVRNNNFFPGGIQFSESNSDIMLLSKEFNDNNKKLSYNDGKWHHVAMIRKGGEIQLWLDGTIHSFATTPGKVVSIPGQITMMNMLPGNLSVNGSICNLAVFNFALQPHQVRVRNTYSIMYRVRGIVTLRGVPFQATLRFYQSSTGELIQELLSDPDTGEYVATFYNNSTVDLLVFDKSDKSVRYRAYGPITPSELIDVPIII